jgi:hypothetical protein
MLGTGGVDPGRPNPALRLDCGHRIDENPLEYVKIWGTPIQRALNELRLN